jgi:CcmD family protein
MIKRSVFLAMATAMVLSLLSLAPGVAAQPQATVPAQDEFVPVSSLPPDEQLPAAPLLVAAYGFVWVALLVYVWSIWRRLSRVERDIAVLNRQAADMERRL